MSGENVDPHEPIILFSSLTTRHMTSCGKSCELFCGGYSGIDLALMWHNAGFTR